MSDNLLEFDKCGLHLKILNDLTNSFANSAKKGRYLKAFEAGIGENYMNGGLELEFCVTTRTEGANFQFILSRDALYARVDTTAAEAGADIKIADRNVVCLYARAEGKPVFMRTGNVPKASEDIVPPDPFPGGIWRITFQNWMECGRDVFAGVASHRDIEILGAAPKREVTVSLERAIDQMRGRTCPLVKCVPEIFNDVVCNTPNSRGELLKNNFYVCFSGLIIEFFDHSCRVRLEEALNNEFQLLKLIVRPTY